MPIFVNVRSFIAILLVSAFVLQSASKLLIIAGYEINKEYIAKNLCENKAKPQLKCNGKCHLKKELQKAEKKEKSIPAASKEKGEIQLFSVKKTALVFIDFFRRAEVNSNYLFPSSQPHLSSIFHPPLA